MSGSTITRQERVEGMCHGRRQIMRCDPHRGLLPTVFAFAHRHARECSNNDRFWLMIDSTMTTFLSDDDFSI
jgi:hypothetical protein